jgi:amidase
VWQEVVAAFTRFDVLILPNDPTDPYGFDDNDAGEQFDWTFLLLAPLLGLPVTTVPCGLSREGIPRGLQIHGRPGADLEVLQVAYAYEQATQHSRQRPPLD